MFANKTLIKNQKSLLKWFMLECLNFMVKCNKFFPLSNEEKNGGSWFGTSFYFFLVKSRVCNLRSWNSSKNFFSRFLLVDGTKDERSKERKKSLDIIVYDDCNYRLKKQLEQKREENIKWAGVFCLISVRHTSFDAQLVNLIFEFFKPFAC